MVLSFLLQGSSDVQFIKMVQGQVAQLDLTPEITRRQEYSWPFRTKLQCWWTVRTALLQGGGAWVEWMTEGMTNPHQLSGSCLSVACSQERPGLCLHQGMMGVCLPGFLETSQWRYENPAHLVVDPILRHQKVTWGTGKFSSDNNDIPSSSGEILSIWGPASWFPLLGCGFRFWILSLVRRALQ